MRSVLVWIFVMGFPFAMGGAFLLLVRRAASRASRISDATITDID